MDCYKLVMKSFSTLQAPCSLLKLFRAPRSVWGIFLTLILACMLVMPFGAMAEAPPIQSAAEIDYPPFSIVDADGRADGFSVELMRAALKAMNREVTFRTGPWEEVRGWLERGEIQALPLVGRTPEREHLFDFTFPYMTLHGAIVVREDNRDIHDLGDLRGRQVAVMKGDNADEFLTREERGIQIRTTTTFEEALRLVSKGECDAVVVQRLVALRLIQEMGLTNLKVLDRPIEGFRQDFCFAVREGDRETLALLNEGLAIVMADGAYRHLHAKWFAGLQLPTERPIVIAGDHNYPPFEYLDDKGRPAGFTVELTRAIAREMNMDIQIRLGPWAQVLDGLRSGDVDAIQGIFYSQERDRTLDFSQPYLFSYYVSVVHKGSGPPPETVAELAGRSLVVQEGDVIHDFLVKQGLGSQISVVETQEDVLRAVSQGQYDCAIALRVSALYLIKKNGWTNLALGSGSFFSGEYSYAVPKGQSALLAQFSEGLKVVEENGEYRRIHDKWLGSYKEAPPSLVSALRYSAMVLIPLIMILLAVFLWSWTLRRRVAERTRDLRESSEFQRAMIACSPVALYSVDLEGKVLAWNESAEKIFGWKAEDVIGNPLPIVPEDRKEEFSGLRRRLLQSGGFSGVEVVRQRKDGSLLDASLSAAPIYNAKGKIIAIMGSMADITDRKRAEASLRESEKKYHDMILNLMEGFHCVTLDGRLLEYNKEFINILKLDPEKDHTGMRLPDFWQDPNDRQAYLDEMERNGFIKNYEIRAKNADGDNIVVLANARMVKNLHGESVRIEGSFLDISAQKHAESEREKLQAQFIQAQKMESVGRLAGGVAHDFNNKLTVILGYAQMAMENLDRTDPIKANLQQVIKAGEQSVQIVSQLLAFARKQTIAPKVLDLNETIEGMLKMLRRLIGEDVDLAWEPDSDLWSVKMDPSQIDQILANLCVNARDAISGVGKVTLETENRVLDESYCEDHPGSIPGEYVMLAVSDDGIGMDKETLANAFEPFFTTKEVGKGTGLGLSTVYGIVKQNQGFVNIYSEPGRGTCFKIYLPRHPGEAEDGIEAVETEIPRGRGETILVVEDETSVLGLARSTLENLGYGVLTSANPKEAIAMAREHAGEIHLLITDVVLPEMSGKDLAGEMMQIRPNTRVLFMSGYTANVIARQGVLDKGVHFIEKPFTPDSLARKVREALGSEK
jgi:PAS domain S-box-containing protein